MAYGFPPPRATLLCPSGDFVVLRSETAQGSGTGCALYKVQIGRCLMPTRGRSYRSGDPHLGVLSAIDALRVTTSTFPSGSAGVGTCHRTLIYSDRPMPCRRALAVG